MVLCGIRQQLPKEHDIVMHHLQHFATMQAANRTGDDQPRLKPGLVMPRVTAYPRSLAWSNRVKQASPVQSAEVGFMPVLGVLDAVWLNVISTGQQAGAALC